MPSDHLRTTATFALAALTVTACSQGGYDQEIDGRRAQLFKDAETRQLTMILSKDDEVLLTAKGVDDLSAKWRARAFVEKGELRPLKEAKSCRQGPNSANFVKEPETGLYTLTAGTDGQFTAILQRKTRAEAARDVAEYCYRDLPRALPDMP